jgi:hypothetical protein
MALTSSLKGRKLNALTETPFDASGAIKEFYGFAGLAQR